jgi:hypothetical protein
VGFVRELGRRFGPKMVKTHAKVDDQSAIASVWPNMRPIGHIDSLAAFIADKSPDRVGA